MAGSKIAVGYYTCVAERQLICSNEKCVCKVNKTYLTKIIVNQKIN